MSYWKFPIRWEEFVRLGLKSETGDVPLSALYRAVWRQRSRANLPISRQFKATIRRVLQQSARFVHVTRGVWRLRDSSANPSELVTA